MMELERLDHLVLTVRDLEATCAFYERILGMRRVAFEKGRLALRFGGQKINLHPYPSPIDPKAAVPEPGTADLCFIAQTPIEAVCDHLRANGVEIEVGPKTTAGALGPMTSVYIRDPDGNLIEIANYQDG
jgi:catechol 2,3-dioxygenase-like lactoylglutathione lyase family enzyme